MKNSTKEMPSNNSIHTKQERSEAFASNGGDSASSKKSDEIKSVDVLANELCQDKDDLPEIYDNVTDAAKGLEMKNLLKKTGSRSRSQVYKNGNVSYKDGMPISKGPIVKVNFTRDEGEDPTYNYNYDEHVDAMPAIQLDINSEEGSRVAQNYGHSNYESVLDFSAVAYEGRTSISMEGLIPDVDDGKLFCSSEGIESSKDFCRKNKAKMANQMNVVALYSLKDQKPFYYISSAEARLAIDYIKLCRDFKQDIVQKNMDFINNVVLNVGLLMESMDDDNTSEICLWDRDLSSYIDDAEGMGDRETIIYPVAGIVSIHRQICLPKTIDGQVIAYNKHKVIIDQGREVTKRVDQWVDSMMNLHIAYNAPNNAVHHLCCGLNVAKPVMDSLPKEKKANTVERTQFGMLGHKYCHYFKGDMGVFVNENLNPNSIVIVSKDLSQNKTHKDSIERVTICEYLFVFADEEGAADRERPDSWFEADLKAKLDDFQK